MKPHSATYKSSRKIKIFLLLTFFYIVYRYFLGMDARRLL